MLEFDNVICSPWFGKVLEEYRAAELAPDPAGGLMGMIAGVSVRVSEYCPEKSILLMRGQVLVRTILVVPTSVKG